MKLKKLLAILMSVMLVLTMMPAVAFAGNDEDDDGSITWGEGNSEEEVKSSCVVNYMPKAGKDHTNPEKINWVKFKKGTYNNFKFVNMDEEYGIDEKNGGLAEEDKVKIANYELGDWGRIASKIFKSGSRVGSGNIEVDKHIGVSGATMLHDWDYYFETDKIKNGRINLPDWFAKENQEQKNYSAYPASWEIKTTGLKKASSLADVRTEMIRLLGKYCPESQIKEYRGKNEIDGGTLSLMKNDKVREEGVFYKIVTHFTEESLMGDNSYNAYAIVLYDLCRSSLGGNGLYYPMDENSETYFKDPRKDPDDIPMRNPDSVQTEGQINYTTNYSQTMSVEHSVVNGFANGISGGGSMEFGTADKCPLPISIKGSFHVDGHMDYSMQDTKTNGSSSTTDNAKGATYTSPLLPHTGKVFTNYKVNQVDTVLDYTDPCWVSYKIAVCSIGGFVTRHNTVDVQGDFCTFFEPAVKGGGDDAVTNLYKRRKSGNVGESYAHTEGYTWNKQQMEKLEWEKSPCLSSEEVIQNGKSEKINEVLDYKESTIPLVNQHMGMEITQDDWELDGGASNALFSLEKVELEDDSLRETINITEGEDYNLTDLKVVGYDNGGENGVPTPYYGFDPKKGHWEVADYDKNGKELPKGIISINTNSTTGIQTLHANRALKEGEEAYIYWRMDATYKPMDPKEKTIDDANLPDRPFIQVNCHSLYENYTAKFIKDSAECIAGERVNLNSALPVNIMNDAGYVVSHAAEYRFEDETIPTSEAEIKDGTYLTVKKDVTEEAGYRDYGIKIKYKSKEFPDQRATMRVTPARKLILIPSGEERIVGPSMRINGTGTVFDLMDYLEYRDQFDEPWTGDIPDWTFKVTKGNEDGKNAVINSEEGTLKNIMTVTKPGDYEVKVSPDVTDPPAAIADATTTLKLSVVENPNQADPKVNADLVYNGKELVGVEDGVGYQVSGGTAVDAGDHYATAMLDKGYDWADGYESDVRQIKFTIDPKPVKKPTAKQGLAYTGKAQQGVPSGEGYDLENAEGIDPGSYEAYARVKGNYTWEDGTVQTLSIPFTIGKGVNPLKLKAKKAKVSYKKLKKKTRTLSRSKAFTVSGAQGKVTYKKSKGNKKIKIDSKSGKVTIKKGLKRGTYKVKVKVTAAGNKNYNGATRSVTFKIRVK